MSRCERCGGKDHATADHVAATASVFHMERCYLQVLDDGVYLHVEDDHYSGKLDAVDALALAEAIRLVVKGSST